MSFLNSLLISFIGLGLVFVVLIGLSAAITLESKVLNFFRGKDKKPISDINDDSSIAEDNAVNWADAGELKLIEVEEKTAAMIMAIVSEESEIPLAELHFKSIKALN
ncbi:MAG: OadG family protein [Clostridiaceae bacterium]|jgi:Na+-transporting methylmalonyl-CoA/oxaloacetate decarboxylase gamma subunit|nr:OadG family protein [Clostridiaceae bacterium]